MEYQGVLENHEAEQAVLGSILMEGDLLQETTLRATDFYRTTHQQIFKAMRKALKEEGEVDIVTVATALDDKIEQVGGISFLTGLAESVPTLANFKTYERMIKEKSRIRQARKLGAELANATEEDEIEAAKQALEEIRHVDEKKARTTQEIISDIFEKMSTPTAGLTGIPTGLEDLNNMTGGWQNSDLIIVAARPSLGKTAFALSLAKGNCETGGVTDIFSLEMPDIQLTQRMLSNVGHVNGSKWRNPYDEFTNEDHENMALAIGEYEKWKVRIHDEAALTVYDIRSKVKESMKEFPNEKHLVVIDYLQLITPVGKFDRNDLAIGHISRELKKMAREFNIPVIALSQLSRGVEQRQDKRPMMSDIRESGSIEQDADVIGFLYRDDYYNRDTDMPGITEIILAKQRNGKTGTVQTFFRKEYGQFLNLSRQQEAKLEEVTQVG